MSPIKSTTQCEDHDYKENNRGHETEGVPVDDFHLRFQIDRDCIIFTTIPSSFTIDEHS